MSKKPEVTPEQKKILWAIALGAIEYRPAVTPRANGVTAFLGGEEIEGACMHLLRGNYLEWTFASNWFLSRKGRRAL